MNTLEKESLKEALTNLISRLEELLKREIETEEGWDRIHLNIKTVHETFKNVVNANIKQCKSILDDVDSSSWPYAFFNSVVEHYYDCSFQLRNLYPFLFAPPPPNRLYYYLFLSEMLNCFPKKDNMPSAIRYVMMGTGNLAYWPIPEMLIGKITSFQQLLIPEVRQMLQEVNATNISGFECDFEESLDRQVVLAHEIFHALVKLNQEIKEKFREIIEKPEVIDIFAGIGQPLNIGHIEELFCDFGAAWFFGPTYAKAFIEEIVFRERERTETHPQRIIRLLMILSTCRKKKKLHPYFQVFSRYLRGQREETNLSLQDIEIIAEEFRTILQNLELDRYIPPDEMDRVKGCIENNISFIYTEQGQDVRELFNNLPDRTILGERERKNYNEFMFESIRKNIMLYQFNEEKRRLQPKLPPQS